MRRLVTAMRLKRWRNGRDEDFGSRVLKHGNGFGRMNKQWWWALINWRFQNPTKGYVRLPMLLCMKEEM